MKDRLVRKRVCHTFAPQTGTKVEERVTVLCCLNICPLIVTALSAFLSMAKRHLEWILCEQTPRNMITLS